MTDYFKAHGRALLANGYLIIPIKPGHKRPALDNWQNARLGAADLARYPGCGVGVLCGQGAQPIAAIDIDTTDAALADRFVEYCRTTLGVTAERVGKAPKILLAYRAAGEGWSKTTGAWFADGDGARHRVEVLGRGQQFVAYHIHPDTGAPYEWVDLFGGIEALRASDLPVITDAQVAEALRVFEDMAAEAGLARVSPGVATATTGIVPADDPLSAHTPPVGMTLTEARALLDHLAPDDYDTWLRAGMALHHEYAGADEALALWNDWSMAAPNYAGHDDLAQRWAGFGRGGHAPTTARWLLKAGREAERTAVHDEKRAALIDARSRIEACRDSINLVNDVARYAGEAAGTDLALRAELAGLIRAKFKVLTDTALSVVDVRIAMQGGRKAAAPRTRQRRAMTEFGNAERLLDHYSDGLLFVPEIGTWYSWTGVYWRRCVGVELEHLAKETIRALPDEVKDIDNDTERAEFFKFCAASQKAVMVRNIVSLAASDPRVVVPMIELDRHTHLLGVANGAIDLRTGELIAPTQEHHITTIAAVDYEPTARAPLFEQTVADVFFDDTEMVAFFQRLIGYTLLADPKEDVLVIPYGSGSNGKSTVLGAIRDALGGHARMASADTFLSSGSAGSAGSAREDVLRLRGARFVYVSEPDEGSELREGLVKSMTGGEALPARGLYAKTTVEVAPTWVAFMPTNHRPIIKGDDHAIWRRLLPVPFTRNFDSDLTVDKDPDRAAKLADEAPGILAWCVRGALAYQRDGLQPPAAVRQAREDYKDDMDLLSEWLNECCEIGPGLTETSANLWASWESFARSRGELRFIASSKSLGRRLSARFSTRKSVGVRGFFGLRVRGVGSF